MPACHTVLHVKYSDELSVGNRRHDTWLQSMVIHRILGCLEFDKFGGVAGITYFGVDPVVDTEPRSHRQVLLFLSGRLNRS